MSLKERRHRNRIIKKISRIKTKMVNDLLMKELLKPANNEEYIISLSSDFIEYRNQKRREKIEKLKSQLK